MLVSNGATQAMIPSTIAICCAAQADAGRVAAKMMEPFCKAIHEDEIAKNGNPIFMHGLAEGTPDQ